MNKNGVENSDSLDLISKTDSYVNLIIVQTNTFTSDLFPSFQDKINNYLSFAKDGPMLENYPELENIAVRITIDMHVPTNEQVLELFQKTKEVLIDFGIEFKWRNLA